MTAISFWHRLADLIAPRMCTVCGRRLSVSELSVCARCNLHLPRTGFQLTPYDNPMARLFWGIIPTERVAALFYYEAHSEASNIVYDMKYHDHPETAYHMGRLLGREMGQARFFDGIDLIVPIPLAANRQRQRGYNQSMELAKGISNVTKIPVCSRAVRRIRFEKSQTLMNRQERIDNVEYVFELADPQTVDKRHVLLVDDVVTTGATMTACARQLLQTGNTTISMASLAFAKA